MLKKTIFLLVLSWFFINFSLAFSFDEYKEINKTLKIYQHTVIWWFTQWKISIPENLNYTIQSSYSNITNIPEQKNNIKIPKTNSLIEYIKGSI